MKITITGMFKLVLIIMVSCSHLFAQEDRNYDENMVPDYELPELLIGFDGKIITTAEEWTSYRRPEILDSFAKNMYGRVPLKKVHTQFRINQINEHAWAGSAIFKEVVAIFSDGTKQAKMCLLIYLPTNISKPVPVFLGMNFNGNHTVHPDTNISLTDNWVRNIAGFSIHDNKATDQSRGVSRGRWPIERILERGYGLATLYYGDLDPDFDDGFNNGIHPLFYDINQSKPKADEWGSIGAWSWGLSRALDYFEKDDDINQERIIVMGHSRLGKAALWAGAQDQRFAIVISNNSGCGGAALSMRRFGETVKIINKKFPHWFATNFKKYNDKEDLLPIDQHMLIALIAPRPVYIASAQNDLWADPRGEFLSARYAGEVYNLLGKKGLNLNELPKVNNPLFQSSVGYHIREGEHDVTKYDWERFMDFADYHFKKREE